MSKGEAKVCFPGKRIEAKAVTRHSKAVVVPESLLDDLGYPTASANVLSRVWWGSSGKTVDIKH